MLLDLLLTGNIQSAIISFLLSVPIIILVLSVHEYAHGLVAKKLGDPTADSLGRLTLNPLKHIDPIGFLMFLLLGIGYAKPVPINSRYFKKPRRDMALVGAAGPLSNLAMALIFTFLTKLFFLLVPFLPETAPDWSYTALSYMHTILRLGIFYNLSFMIFNFIPVPPLDGSRILYAFLPTKALLWVQRYEQYFFWGILGLFLVSSFLNLNIIGWIVNLITYLLCMLFSIPFIPL
ncbi:MAG: site-2 protease family protein [Ruminococcaceae bacterium]|nr:site-2 protease family protein [Oscillospiraceae bacterium]